MPSFSSDPAIDAAYRPSAALAPGVFDAHLQLYRERSAAAYRDLPHERDICYDAASGQCLDIFPAAGARPQPTFVFIHGGYWRALGKEDSVFMAGALTRRGISVVSIDYTLAPAATLEEIVRQARASIAWLHTHGAAHGIDPDRLFVGGHSAGGHLAASLIATGWRESMGLPEDVVKGAMFASGLFDLAPIARSFVNEWLGLDAERVRALSPIRHLPARAGELVIAWGGAETSGFKDQSNGFVAACDTAGFLHRALEVPERHHFDLVLDWCFDDSTMTEACAAMVLAR